MFGDRDAVAGFDLIEQPRQMRQSETSPFGDRTGPPLVVGLRAEGE
jgi:hypothetical protein